MTCRQERRTSGFSLWRHCMTCSRDIASIIHTKQRSPKHGGIQFLYFTLQAPLVRCFVLEAYFTWNADTPDLGLPKPIISNHATWAVIDNDRNLPPVKGRRNQNYALWNFPGDGGRYFAAFPPFHVSRRLFATEKTAETPWTVARRLCSLDSSSYLLDHSHCCLRPSGQTPVWTSGKCDHAAL